MRELYNESYYRNYGIGQNSADATIDYGNKNYWETVFNNIAQKIVADFSPKTALDVGCAWGYLVAALRDLGVEAYGVDISPYAISMVRDDIKPYCIAGSATDNLPESFPNRFDLVITIEMIEHLYEEDCLPVIEKLCSYSDKILMSSSPDDITDATHFNVQQPEYWAKRFAEFRFFNNVNYKPDYISKDTILFEKSNDIPKIVFRYEHFIRLLLHNSKLQFEESNKMSITSFLYPDIGNGIEEARKITIGSTLGQPVKYQMTISQNMKSLRFDPVEGSFCVVNTPKILTDKGYLACENLNGYKIGEYHIFLTKDPQFLIKIPNGVTWVSLETEVYPVQESILLDVLADMKNLSDQAQKSERLQQDFIQKIDELKTQILELTKYKNDYHAVTSQLQAMQRSTFWRMTKPGRVVVGGIKGFFRKFPLTRLLYKGLWSLRRNGIRATLKHVRIYSKRKKQASRIAIQSIKISATDRKLQNKKKFSKIIKFSIITPLYNTPEVFLREMIESVINQSYSNWEICLADGSDDKHRHVEKICKEYEKKDSRIIYKKLIKNEGISDNTNQAIAIATGDYFAMLDHDDILHASALYEVMNVICEKNADLVYTDEAIFSQGAKTSNIDIKGIHFKCDFASDTLRSQNYMTHFCCYSHKLFEKVGGYESRFDGSQDYDMILRLVEVATSIVHIPKILYYWRAHDTSVADGNLSAKSYAIASAKAAIGKHLERIGLSATVLDSEIIGMYKINYDIKDEPLISIIIPNKDHIDDLKQCINSIFSKSSYKNFELIIVENNSTSATTFEYYKTLEDNERIKVVSWDGVFNYPAINNFGVSHAKGDYILLLNNDTEVITPDWLQEMLMFAQRPDVGAVGAKLYYPDDTIQHAGVIVGLGGVAGHSHKYFHRSNPGYMSRLKIAQNLTAVTAACMMIRRDVYEEVGGLDEKFSVAFNDVDLCMRIRKKGYLVVFTPFAELYHYESKSRGIEDTPEKQARFSNEVQLFQTRWAKELEDGDPYYNPNLTLDREDFSFR